MTTHEFTIQGQRDPAQRAAPALLAACIRAEAVFSLPLGTKPFEEQAALEALRRAIAEASPNTPARP